MRAAAAAAAAVDGRLRCPSSALMKRTHASSSVLPQGRASILSSALSCQAAIPPLSSRSFEKSDCSCRSRCVNPQLHFRFNSNFS